MSARINIQLSVFGLLAGIILVSTAAAEDCAGDLLLAADSIGPLKLGMTESEVAALNLPVRADRRYSEEVGAEVMEMAVTVCKGVVVTANFNMLPTVYSLSTQSSAISTREGAHVGMSVAQLSDLYPSGQAINYWNEGVQRSFIIDDGAHGVFMFGSGPCEPETDNLTSDCNKLLPEEKSIEYWTNGAYPTAGIWSR